MEISRMIHGEDSVPYNHGNFNNDEIEDSESLINIESIGKHHYCYLVI